MSGGASRQGGPTTNISNLCESTHDMRPSIHQRLTIPLADCLPASVDSLGIFRQALTRYLL